MPRLRPSNLLALACAAAAALSLGCQGSSADCYDSLANQPKSRFPAGETYWLPTPRADSACANDWSLTSAPPGNTNQVVVGSDGYARFSPVLPGTYTFTSGGGATEAFTAVAADSIPFHNLNYYPARSIAKVGAELWVADVFTPRVTRLDPATLAPLGQIAVGAWPVALAWTPAAPFAVVAQRGSDTLGLIDVAHARLVDAVWVGDEPSNVVLDAAGKRAYVALATQAKVAVVDLATRTRSALVDVGPDPLGLALSPDGKTLAVLSHRSGQASRAPFGTDPTSTQRDLTLVDTATGTVRATFAEVGTTLGDVLWAPDGSKLYVAGLTNDTQASLADPAAKSFVHEVVALDPATGARLASADLSRQPGTGGAAVSLRGLALSGGALWVTAEGSDVTIRLDPGTLAELSRTPTPGRPRGILADGGTVYVHGAQAFQISALGDKDGKPVAMATAIAPDPRPEPVARGQAYFTGAGESYGTTWSCNSCHADGLTDTLVWKAGPVADWAVVRPLVWLEGANPLGWAGYLSSVRNYAYTVSANVGIRPTTDQAEGLWAYIASLMPPPAATGDTARDGALSAQGRRGEAIFQGKGGCTTCHAGDLTTNKRRLDPGISPGATQVPPLVGAYRYNVWLKHGQARTLGDAVSAAADYTQVSLTSAELADLTEYVQELTDRTFFVLSSTPSDGEQEVAAGAPIQLTFSAPIFADPANLARIHLADARGASVAVTASAQGRLVTLTPSKPLAPGASYEVTTDAALEAFDERRASPFSLHFNVAGAPSIQLQGDYVWTVSAPTLDFTAGKFDPSHTIPDPVSFHFTPSPSGAALHIDYGQGLSLDVPVTVDGAHLRTGSLPLPLGPTAFTDSTGIDATLVDSDGDGVADSASGTMNISGPGFSIDGIAWSLARPAPMTGGCNEGTTGSPAPTVTKDAQGNPVIDWGTGSAVALYVTDPQAKLPQGPGMVTGGKVYWSLQTSAFPSGFAGPVTYGNVPMGATDTTSASGGGAVTPLVAGQCYAFSVVDTKFSTGVRVMKW